VIVRSEKLSSTRLYGLIEDLRKKEDRLALVLSVVVGSLTGLVVVAFVLLTGRLAAHAYPPGGSGWRRLLIPAAGSLITGLLLYRYFPLARGSGIPQTRAALFIHDGRISMRSVVGKFVCCATSLASGIALGREGPSVFIGAGIGSVIARRLGLSKAHVKWLVPVGGAAALAAAFNTPIAAVLFALEEIMGDLHAPILGSVVLSSTTSWMVLHLVLGDEPLFHVPAYHLVSSGELVAYAALGLAGGVCSVIFVKLLLSLRAWFARLPAKTQWIQPLAGGLTVGILGWFVPQVLGVGYDQVDNVLNGDTVVRMIIMLAALKIVATAMCYASGNAGGIFGPSMFIGAMIGGAVGSLVHSVFPASTGNVGAYALVGMGTAFAGIIRTPLTSVIMIFEVTRDYTIIVPLMISNLIAFFVSQKLQPEPIYEALAHQDGLHLPTREFRAGSAKLTVTAAIREAPPSLDAALPISEAASRVMGTGPESWIVEDEKGLVGLVRTADIIGSQNDHSRTLRQLLEQDVPHPGDDTRDVPHVHLDHSLGLALARMGESGHRILPVVSRGNARMILGVVTLPDVLKGYGVSGREHPDEDESDDEDYHASR
jgi:CIC family chloride channel protein